MFPEVIKITVAQWSHIQEIDYEQLPFKCCHCHGYGHFAQNCKKKSEEEFDKEKVDQWTQVQKAGTSKQDNKTKGKGGNTGNGFIPVEKIFFKPHAVEKAIVSSNPFVVLSPSEDQNSLVL